MEPSDLSAACRALAGLPPRPPAAAHAAARRQQVAARSEAGRDGSASSSGDGGGSKGSETPFVRNTEFGYSRKDIILIGVGLIALGYALYYGLQALGMDPGMAGNWVQLTIFLGICVGWVGSYVFRVGTKVGRALGVPRWGQWWQMVVGAVNPRAV